MKTYEQIPATAGAVLAIKCLLCNRVSFNVGDILNQYCAHCRIFHDDLARVLERILELYREQHPAAEP